MAREVSEPVRDVSGSATGITDAAGAITLRITGPFRIGTRWSISSATIESVRGTVGYPTASIYRSVIERSSLIGTSRSADAVTFDGQGDWLLPGDQLVAVIEGTAPGSRATFNMYATEVDQR